MENKKICDCPFYEWCHEPRQGVRKLMRELGHEKSVEECNFYQSMKKEEDVP